MSAASTDLAGPGLPLLAQLAFPLLQLAAALGASALVVARGEGRAPARALAGLAFGVGAVVGALGLGWLLALPGAAAQGQLPPWPGPAMALGALGGAAAATSLAARGSGASAWRALDAAAPSLGLLVVLGRLGCAVAGCCFGVGWTGPLAVVHPPGSPCAVTHALRGEVAAGAPSAPVVPVQLLEVALGAAMVALGLAVRRARCGRAFAVVLAVYAAGRFALEALRDDPRPMAGGWSLAQWLSVVALAAAVGSGLGRSCPTAQRWTHEGPPRAPRGAEPAGGAESGASRSRPSKRPGQRSPPMPSRVPRALALLLSLAVTGAVVFQACSRGAPAPAEPVVLPEPAALADPPPAAAPPLPAQPSSATAASSSPAPRPPDFMGASKAAPVFHPHPKPSSAPPAQLAP